MDLSFTRFDRHREVTLLPADLAVLMVGVATRQAASPTARAQVLATPAAASTPCTEPGSHLLQPPGGAFNEEVAACLVRWTEP